MPRNAPQYDNCANEEQIFSLGVSLSCGKQTYGQVWIFDIASQREYEEFLAACDAMAEDLEGAYCRALTSDDGALHIQIMGRASSQAQAALSINHATIAFSALSQWGCGPVSGLGPMSLTHRDPLLQEALVLREAYQLAMMMPTEPDPAPISKPPSKSL